MISNFAVDLSGYINFVDKRGTGMYLQSGIVNNSRLIFMNNTAKCGGAIVFNSFSVMYLQQLLINLIKNWLLSMMQHNSMELDATNVPYISNGNLHLKANGIMEESNVLQLNYEHTTISIDITTIECRPGWYISDNNCMCGQSQFVGV